MEHKPPPEGKEVYSCPTTLAKTAFWTGATGAVLRDQDGATFGGSAKWYDHCLNPLTTEALACRDGMQYAQRRGVRKKLCYVDGLPGVGESLGEGHIAKIGG